ncbi:MAG: CapA family protein [Burkholderiales bacterium]|nr:CapA family protein [Burkholderiales bacterium]
MPFPGAPANMTSLAFLTGGDVAPVGRGGQGIFGDVAPLFRRADVSFFNLELPLSERGEAVRGKSICHRGLPAVADGLREAGVSCVNLANNHVLDFGDAALHDTLDLLDARAIGRFGAGRSLDEARRRCVVGKNGLRVGFLGYTTTLPAGFAATADHPGVNPLQAYTAYQAKASLVEYPGTAPRVVTWTDSAHLQRLRAEVAAAAADLDCLIVYVHWGTSMSPEVHDFQREIGTAAIDAGAHAVFGGHQHVISAIGHHRGRPIVHGSANLLFDTRPAFFTAETLKTFLFGATIGPDGLRDCYVLPVRTGVNEPPRPLGRGDPLWQSIADDIGRHSSPFGTRLTARGDVLEVCASQHELGGR